MMNKFIFITIVVCTFVLCNQKIVGQGHEIKVKVKGLRDSMLILGYHMDGKMLADDTAFVNKSDEAVFKGDKLKFGGMYFIYFPSRSVVNILMGDDQTFLVKVDKSNIYETMEVTGSIDNELFYKYESFLKEKGGAVEKIRKEMDGVKEADKKKELQKGIEKINDEVMAEQSRIIKEYPKTFFARFVKATQPVKVPDTPSNITDDSKKRDWQYFYYKDHFWDNMDLKDSSMLRTAIFKPKLDEFLQKVVIQIPDTIIKEMDILIKKTKGNKEVFKYVLGSSYNFYNKSQLMGMDAVFVYLADYYLRGDADWNDPDYLKKLKEQVDKIRPNLIGKIAPDFTVPDLENKRFKLSELNSKYTVLWFFEPDCSHCIKETPIMHAAYERIKHKGVSIVCFYTQGDTAKWKEFVKKNNLYDWINVWSPYSNDYRNAYNIYSTPTTYILDSLKRILAKRIGPDQIEKIILEKILLDETRDMEKPAKMNYFRNFLSDFQSKEAIDTVKIVMLAQTKDEETTKEIEVMAAKQIKIIEIRQAFMEDMNGVPDNEKLDKIKIFISKYKSKDELLVVKEIVEKQIMAEKDIKEALKLIEKRMKEI